MNSFFGLVGEHVGASLLCNFLVLIVLSDCILLTTEPQTSIRLLTRINRHLQICGLIDGLLLFSSAIFLQNCLFMVFFVNNCPSCLAFNRSGCVEKGICTLRQCSSTAISFRKKPLFHGGIPRSFLL